MQAQAELKWKKKSPNIDIKIHEWKYEDEIERLSKRIIFIRSTCIFVIPLKTNQGRELKKANAERIFVFHWIYPNDDRRVDLIYIWYENGTFPETGARCIGAIKTNKHI